MFETGVINNVQCTNKNRDQRLGSINTSKQQNSSRHINTQHQHLPCSVHHLPSCLAADQSSCFEVYWITRHTWAADRQIIRFGQILDMRGWHVGMMREISDQLAVFFPQKIQKAIFQCYRTVKSWYRDWAIYTRIGDVGIESNDE